MHKHHYALHCVISFTLCTLTWYISAVVAVRQQLEFIILKGSIWTAPFKWDNVHWLMLFWYVPFAVTLLLPSNRYARLVWMAIPALLMLLPLQAWNETQKEVIVDWVVWAENVFLIMPALVMFAVMALLKRRRKRTVPGA